MPNKHFYFAMGAANGTLISIIVYKSRRYLAKKYRFVRNIYRFDRDWFLYFPFFIGFMGTIALIPDILHGLHILKKEITRGSWFNVFYFHSYFEWLEDHNHVIDWILNSLGSGILLLLSIGILIYYVHKIKEIIRNHQL